MFWSLFTAYKQLTLKMLPYDFRKQWFSIELWKHHHTHYAAKIYEAPQTITLYIKSHKHFFEELYIVTNFRTVYTWMYSIGTAISLCDLIHNLQSQFLKQLKKKKSEILAKGRSWHINVLVVHSSVSSNYHPLMNTVRFGISNSTRTYWGWRGTTGDGQTPNHVIKNKWVLNKPTEDSGRE